MLNMCTIKSIACHHSPLDGINYIPQLGNTNVLLLPYAVRQRPHAMTGRIIDHAFLCDAHFLPYL